MSAHRRPTTAAAALAVLAIAAPTAAAKPAYEPVQSTTTEQAAAEPTPAPTPAAANHGGIEWGSTALGAGGTAVVFALAGAGLVTVSRHRRHVLD